MEPYPLLSCCKLLVFSWEKILWFINSLAFLVISDWIKLPEFVVEAWDWQAVSFDHFCLRSGDCRNALVKPAKPVDPVAMRIFLPNNSDKSSSGITGLWDFLSLSPRAEHFRTHRWSDDQWTLSEKLNDFLCFACAAMVLSSDLWGWISSLTKDT